jgi:hypothetical protein
MTILHVVQNGKKLTVTYPANHKQADDIERWFSYELSPGYIEWMLQVGSDPHCTNCRDMDCENFGNGDDACKGFKFGEKW